MAQTVNSSASRNFSTVLHGTITEQSDRGQPNGVTAARMAAIASRSARADEAGRRLGSASSTGQAQTAAAAAAAATRRVSAPRARPDAAPTSTRDIGTGPCINAAPQDGVTSKRLPFTIESVLPPIPQSFKCPITHEVMRDPVMTQDGHVYESDAIQEWFRRGHRTSPVTGAELVNLALLPEVPLRRAIEEYMALRPEIARRELALRSDLLTLRNMTEKLEQELKTKDQMLRDGNRGEAAASSSASTSSSTACCPETTSERHEQNQILAGSSKVDSPENLRPALASLPTPCRDATTRGNRKFSEQAPPAPAPVGRTNKMVELIKAMTGRGRSTRRRPTSARARSQDPDAHY